MRTNPEITNPTPLLDGRGQLLRPGWARRMLYLYNRHRVAARPLGLREWDSYRLFLGGHMLQLTMGQASGLAVFAVSLWGADLGPLWNFIRRRPLPAGGPDMPLSPDNPHFLAADGRDFAMAFDVNGSVRRLTLRAEGVDIDLRLPRRRRDEELVAATPLEKTGQFSLSCTAPYYGLRGHARFGTTHLLARPNDTALLDWARGVWPRGLARFSGAGAARLPDGRRFGFALGSENALFVDGRVYRLGAAQVDKARSHPMGPWHFADGDGLFEMTLTPAHSHDTPPKLAFLTGRTRQVFGLCRSRAALAGGAEIQFQDVPGYWEYTPATPGEGGLHA